MTTDNITYCLATALKKVGIQITQELLEEQLQSHPQYPTLKCVSEILNNLRVKHHAVRLEIDELALLPKPFIAHIAVSGGQLAIVDEANTSHVMFRTDSGGRKKLAFTDFASIFTGAVVLMDAKQPSLPKLKKPLRNKYAQRKLLLPLSLLLVVIVAGYLSLAGSAGTVSYLNFHFLTLLSTKFLGIGLTTLLIMHEINIPVALSQRLCHLTPKTDCNGVLRSKEAKLFGLFGLADVGLTYFTVTLTLLLAGQLNLLAWLSLMVLLAPAYTVWAQVKLRMWCPLCVGVQALLIAEFALLAGMWLPLQFTLQDVMLGTLLFTLAYLLLILYRLYHEVSQKSRQQHRAYLALKRQPAVFTSQLAQRFVGQESFGLDAFQFGDASAKVTLTAFMSLQCQHCASTFLELKNLLEDSSGISLQLVMAPPATSDQQLVLSQCLSYHNQRETHTLLSKLGEWYANPIMATSGLKLLSGGAADRELQQWVSKSKEIFAKYRVTGTPYIVVNGFELPPAYSPFELQYYIPEIVTLTQRRKGQEAQTVAQP